MVIVLRPVAQRLLVERGCGHLMFVFCPQAWLFIYIILVHIAEIGYCLGWGLTCNGPVSHQGKSMFLIRLAPQKPEITTGLMAQI